MKGSKTSNKRASKAPPPAPPSKKARTQKPSSPVSVHSSSIFSFFYLLNAPKLNFNEAVIIFDQDRCVASIVIIYLPKLT